MAKQLCKDGNSSEPTSGFGEGIPARHASRNVSFAKDVCASAIEERQAVLSSEPPLSTKPSSRKLSALFSADFDSNDPFDDLSMKLKSLSSQSPTLTPSRHSPRSSLDYVSRANNVPTKATRERSRGRECRKSMPPRKGRVQSSPAPSLATRERYHNRQKSASRGRKNSLDRSLSQLDLAEINFKTSILTTTCSSPGILSSVSRSNSITRTTVSFRISPLPDGSKPSLASQSRSRSHSPRGTPVPPSPKFVNGYRALASDRDIRELLQQRLAQTPKPGEKKATPDLKGWNPPWNNSYLDTGYGENTRETPALGEYGETETTASSALKSFDPSITSGDLNGYPGELCQDPPIGMIKVVGDCNAVGRIDKPLVKQSVEQSDNQSVQTKSSGLSRKRTLTTKGCTKRAKVDDVLWGRGKRVSVELVPDESQSACSACLGIRSRCIRIVESCERCIDRNLRCFVATSIDEEREVQRLQWPIITSETHRRINAPAEYSRREPHVNYQADGLIMAAQPQDLPPIENLHLPQVLPSISSTTVSRTSGIRPLLPFHAHLENQQCYGWVKDWSLVQPQPTQPDRSQSSQQNFIPQPTHNFYATKQYRTKLLKSESQIDIQPSQKFSFRRNTYEAGGYPTFQPHDERAATGNPIFQSQQQPHYPIQTARPVSYFSSSGPLTSSRLLPRPQPQPQPQLRQWHWPEWRGSGGDGREDTILHGQHGAPPGFAHAVASRAKAMVVGGGKRGKDHHGGQEKKGAEMKDKFADGERPKED